MKLFKYMFVLTGLSTGLAAASEPALKVNGFVDFRLSNFSRDASLPSGNAESGFGVEDGALYLTYEKEGVSFLMDLPFRRQKNSDLGVVTDPGVSPTSNLQTGNDKAQVYVKYSPLPSWTVLLGQFDTLYGVELNDSKDRFFGKTGLVYDATLPVTHTGALVQYDLAGGYLKVLAANSNNKGSLGNSATGDNSYEYGTALGYSNSVVRGQIGYLTRPITRANALGSGQRSLTDMTLGFTLGTWSTDLEYSIVGDDNKNILTATDVTDRENDGTGLLLLSSYSFNSEWSAGVRLERLLNDPASTGYMEQSSGGVSVHYKLTPSLEFRAEGISYQNKLVGGTAYLQDRRANFSTLFVF